jgi:hypothetical protein
MGGKNHAASPKPMKIGPGSTNDRVPRGAKEMPRLNSLQFRSLFGRIFIVVGSFVSPLLLDALGNRFVS